MINFEINKAVFAKYPDFFCGVIIAENIDNSKKENKELIDLIRAEEKNKKEKYEGLESLAELEEISSWRKIYKEMGAKKYRASHEAILRRVVKGDELPDINPIVNIYNYISLKYTAPVGGEYIDTIKGDLILAEASGEEEFIPLGQDENQPPKPGEVVYKDDQGVICRRWNWREGDRTKLTEKTKNAVIVIDALPPLTKERVQEALEEMAGLIKKYCGGKIQRSKIF